MSEKTEQAHIVQLLRSIGGTVYVIGTVRRKGDYQGTMQSPGLPDVLAFLPRPPPTMLFIECKTAVGGRLRPAQRDFRDLCARAGIAHIVGSLDAVIAWLVEHHHVAAASFPHYRSAPSARNADSPIDPPGNPPGGKYWT